MKRTLALIELIIEEHKTILQRMDQVANDAEALQNFEKAKEVFMPGRPDQNAGLVELEKLANVISQGLQAHFNREETAVLAVFEEKGGKELASAFNSLLSEHNDLRHRLTYTKDRISRLVSGEIARTYWEATAHDMRAHITHTRKLLEVHANAEQELLQSLHKRLLGEKSVDLPLN